MIARFFRSIAESSLFQNFVLALILLAGALVGLETYPHITQNSDLQHALHTADTAIIWLFAAEALIKILACGSKPHRYFLDPWNLFDFSIVVVCFLPFGGHYAAILRLVRIARVLRLVTALPKLQLVVGALIKSLPAMGYVVLLMSLHFYVYAVLGTIAFGQHDPTHFGTLHHSMLALFQVLTLEGWTSLLDAQLPHNPAIASAYFISFIMIGTMLMLNLVIGVIINSMEEVRQEERNRQLARALDDSERSAADDVLLLQRELDDLRKKLTLLHYRLTPTQTT